MHSCLTFTLTQHENNCFWVHCVMVNKIWC
uniref:Uncharacterized protein n=1 Tax=Rhizophora mucronata TaxID=61149 RepID=A0A2P2NI33_RHIMU